LVLNILYVAQFVTSIIVREPHSCDVGYSYQV